MMIHQYDKVTGQYLSSFLADSDPVREGRWLIPEFCTTEQPPERTPFTWPFWKDGKWTLLPDYRGRKLYRIDSGEEAEIFVAGVKPEDLENGDWKIDPAITARKQHDAVMAEFHIRMAKARAANLGEADALAAGMLSDLDEALFKAWAQYQVTLVNVFDSPNFPQNLVWPEEPDNQKIANEIANTQSNQFLHSRKDP
ncbi:tail fiber assembly protein [Mycetohabitans sp. B2]|uniref:tail fiber assembly protein n=1 Tax=Mycetohabitans sp. B2 TaxID=2841274 RepID=UPI001F1F9231|nr:tail fiber assembly protein [Mycetohabitans sp. B2]MCF7695300.1 tail fiber assembly protein [Mycetohabitans sp. B2]